MTDIEAAAKKISGYVGVPYCHDRPMIRQNPDSGQAVYACSICKSEHYAPSALPPVDVRYDDSISQRFRRS